jgi:hypothetical protein
MITVKKVRDSLIKQLEIKGANVALYESLIDDYMFLLQQERAMQKDIRKKGRTYTALSSTGKEYEKNNPSVKDALLYSRQMVAIITALGLSTETVKTGDKKEDNPDDL